MTQRSGNPLYVRRSEVRAVEPYRDHGDKVSGSIVGLEGNRVVKVFDSTDAILRALDAEYIEVTS